MTTFRRLSKLALGATLALVALGGFTRGSGSGYGCADRWPLCEGGLLGGWLPRAEYNMIIEWSHRFVATMVGLIAVATALAAWRHRRDRPRLFWIPTIAVGVIGFQAWVGRLVVQGELDADLVSVHLTISMIVVALYTVLVVYTRPEPNGASGVVRDRSWTTRLVFGAGLTIAVLLAGSYVHNLYFSGWPLVGNTLIPDLTSRFTAAHFLHRVLAGLGMIYLGYLVVVASRVGRPAAERNVVNWAAAAYLINIILGAGHVLTEVSSSALVAAHLAVGAIAWSLAVAAVAMSSHTGSVRPAQPIETPIGTP